MDMYPLLLTTYVGDSIVQPGVLHHVRWC